MVHLTTKATYLLLLTSSLLASTSTTKAARAPEQRGSQQARGGSGMFVQRLNALTGQAEWVVVDVDAAAVGDGDDGDAGGDGGSNAGLLQGTTYADMLNDEARNDAYNRAIAAAVRPGNLVLDIGTGTGLLAMMAARAMREKQQHPQHAGVGAGAGVKAGAAAGERAAAAAAAARETAEGGESAEAGAGGTGAGAGAGAGASERPQGSVVACEVYPPTAALARRVVRENGWDAITVHNKRSDDLGVGPGRELPRRADAVVSEVLDSELLGEGVLPVMRDALRRLLKRGAAVVPAAATLYAQAVECAELAKRMDAGAVLEVLTSSSPSQPQQQGQQRQWQQQQQRQQQRQQPSRCHAMDVDPLHRMGLLRPLTPPTELFSFDFARPPPPEGRAARPMAFVSAPGRADAVVMWWDLRLDKAGSVNISTRPAWVIPSPPPPVAAAADGGGNGGGGGGGEVGDGDGVKQQQWREHWRQCWFGVSPPLHLAEDDEVVLDASHDDYSVQVGLQPKGVHMMDADVGADGAECNAAEAAAEAKAAAAAAAAARLTELLPAIYGPDALAALGDAASAAAARSALEHAVQRQQQRQQQQGHEAEQDAAAGAGAAAGGAAGRVSVIAAGDSPWLPAVAARTPGVGSVKVLQPLHVAWEAARLSCAAAGVDPDNSGGVGVGVSLLQLDKNEREEEQQQQQRECAAGSDGAQSNGMGAAGTCSADPSQQQHVPASVFAAFPYYRDADALAPWAHLRFWSERDRALASGRLAPSHAIAPIRAVLRGVCASLPDLWRANAALGSDVQGFDLSTANPLLLGRRHNNVGHSSSGNGGGSGSGSGSGGNVGRHGQGSDAAAATAAARDEGEGQQPAGKGQAAEAEAEMEVSGRLLPRAVWQCGSGYREVSWRFPLLELDFSNPVGAAKGRAEVDLTKPVGSDGLPPPPPQQQQLCHAVVLWVDYYAATADGGEELMLSTAPPPDGSPGAWRQGVYLLDRPLSVGVGSSSSSSNFLPTRQQQQHNQEISIGGVGEREGAEPLAASGIEVAAAFDGDDGEVRVSVVACA